MATQMAAKEEARVEEATCSAVGCDYLDLVHEAPFAERRIWFEPKPLLLTLLISLPLSLLISRSLTMPHYAMVVDVQGPTFIKLPCISGPGSMAFELWNVPAAVCPWVSTHNGLR